MIISMQNYSAEELESLIETAEQGNADAQNNLGVMYYFGYGVPQDYKKAFEWYTKAAEQGNAKAQYRLGDMYYFGYGVP